MMYDIEQVWLSHQEEPQVVHLSLYLHRILLGQPTHTVQQRKVNQQLLRVARKKNLMETTLLYKGLNPNFRLSNLKIKISNLSKYKHSSLVKIHLYSIQRLSS